MLRRFGCTLDEVNLTAGAWRWLLRVRAIVFMERNVEKASHLHAPSTVATGAVGHGPDQALVKSDHAHNVSPT